MSAYAGSLHTICRVVFWVFRFDQILVIALYFALHFDQIPSCTQYRRNLFYFQASNEFQPFFNTDQLSCRPSIGIRIIIGAFGKRSGLEAVPEGICVCVNDDINF